MILLDPDEIYSTKDGLLLIKIYPRDSDYHIERTIVYQHLTIKVFNYPQFQNGIHYNDLSAAHHQEVSAAKSLIIREKKMATKLFLQHREKHFIYRPSQGTVLRPQKIVENEILEAIQNLLYYDIDIHIHKIEKKISNHEIQPIHIITLISYDKIHHIQVPRDGYVPKYIQSVIKTIQPAPAIRHFETANYRRTIKLTGDLVSFEPKLSLLDDNHQFTLSPSIISKIVKLRSKIDPHIVNNEFKSRNENHILLGKTLDRDIFLPKSSVLTPSSKLESFMNLMENEYQIKVGGIKPKNFTSIQDIDLHLDLLEYFDNPPEVYNSLLMLIEKVFDIPKFSQIFIQFLDLYKESLSGEQQSRYNLKYLTSMMKDIPLASIEIPIDQKTKVALNMFFLKFTNINLLSQPNDYNLANNLPKKLYIPTSSLKTTSDLVLLHLLVFQSLDYLIKYNVIIIDHPRMRQLILDEQINRNLNWLKDTHLIFVDNNVWRKQYERLNKIILKPSPVFVDKVYNQFKAKLSSNEWYVMNELNRFQSITPLEVAFLPNTMIEGIKHQKEITNDEDDWDWIENEEENSSIQQNSEKELQSFDFNKFTHETKFQSKVKQHSFDDPDDLIDKIINDENKSVKANDSEIDQKPIDQRPVEKSIEKVTKSNPVRPSVNVAQDPSPERIEASQESHYVENVSITVSNASETDELFYWVDKFENIFHIRETVKTVNRTLPSGDVIKFLEEGGFTFSIISRTHYATTSKVATSLLEEKEKPMLQFCHKRKLITLEAGGQFFLNAKGKEMIERNTKAVREFNIDSDSLENLIDYQDDILNHQLKFGPQTHALSKLAFAKLLGIKYFNQFKIVPPLILSIFNFQSKVEQFVVDDPVEFSSLFDAKFVSFLQNYRNDIINNQSQVQDEFIDTSDKPVPLPRVENSDKENENEISTSFEETQLVSEISNDLTLAGKGRFNKPVKLIEDPLTEDLSNHLEESISNIDDVINNNNFSITQTKELDPKEVISNKENEFTLITTSPDLLKSNIIDLRISEFKSNYEETRLKGKIKGEITKDRIYSNKPGLKFEEMFFFDLDLSNLAISKRIVNSLKKVGIVTVEQLIYTKITDGISGIGQKSLEEIMNIKPLLATILLSKEDQINKNDIFYILNDAGQQLMIEQGIFIDYHLLPYDYFIPIEKVKNIELHKFYDELSINDNIIIDITKIAIDHIFQIFNIEVDKLSLEEKINKLSSFQKKNYPLCFADDENFELNFNSIYRDTDNFTSINAEDEKINYIENYKLQIKGKLEKIYVTSKFL